MRLEIVLIVLVLVSFAPDVGAQSASLVPIAGKSLRGATPGKLLDKLTKGRAEAMAAYAQNLKTAKSAVGGERLALLNKARRARKKASKYDAEILDILLGMCVQQRLKVKRMRQTHGADAVLQKKVAIAETELKTRWLAATTLLEDFLRRNPKNKPYRLLAMYNLAVLRCVSKNKPAEAVKTLQRLLKKHPRFKHAATSRKLLRSCAAQR